MKRTYLSLNLNEKTKESLRLKEGDITSKRIVDVISRYNDLLSGYATVEGIFERERSEGRIEGD